MIPNGVLLNGMTRVANEENRPKMADLEKCAPLAGRGRPQMAGDKDNKQGNGDDAGTNVITISRTKVKKPRLYKVLLLNDDYTPMDFVIYVLEQFFKKSRREATSIMLQVHRKGIGVCGVFTYEVAETKVSQVMNFARQNEHPLQCTMEKE